MAYKPGIPLANDLLRVSQQDMADNFDAIDTGFAVNHVSFNNTYVGKHGFVEFVRVDSGESESGDLQLTLEWDDGELRFTEISSNQSMTPSGIKFRYGHETLGAGETTTISLTNSLTEEAISIGYFNAQVTLLGTSSGIDPSVTELANDYLIISNNGNQGKPVYYFVIGY